MICTRAGCRVAGCGYRKCPNTQSLLYLYTNPFLGLNHVVEAGVASGTSAFVMVSDVWVTFGDGGVVGEW